MKILVIQVSCLGSPRTAGACRVRFCRRQEASSQAFSGLSSSLGKAVSSQGAYALRSDTSRCVRPFLAMAQAPDFRPLRPHRSHTPPDQVQQWLQAVDCTRRGFAQKRTTREKKLSRNLYRILQWTKKCSSLFESCFRYQETKNFQESHSSSIVCTFSHIETLLLMSITLFRLQRKALVSERRVRLGCVSRTRPIHRSTNEYSHNV